MAINIIHHESNKIGLLHNRILTTGLPVVICREDAHVEAHSLVFVPFLLKQSFFEHFGITNAA